MPDLQKLGARPESLAQMVFDAIRAAIIDKTLPPGSAISETALARELDVSKTPVREAVLRLCELRLIEREGPRGLRVISPSTELIDQAYELRLALESQAAALAAERSDKGEQDALFALAEKSLAACEANSMAEFRQYDVELHHLVAKASGSPLLAGLAENAIDLTDVLRRRDAPMSQVSLRCAHEHVQLARAIQEGRAADAKALTEAHIKAVHRRVLADFLELNDSSASAVAT